MAKNINIDAHVKRYVNTELSDVSKLAAALNALVEQRTEATITDLENKLALLKSGEIPQNTQPEKAASKKTRGGKKVVSESEEDA